MTKRFRCPECGSTRLWVDITAVADLEQDGDDNIQTFVDGDHHWDQGSRMGCHKCRFEDEAGEFDTEKGD